MSAKPITEPVVVEVVNGNGRFQFREYYTSDFSDVMSASNVNAFALDENNQLLLVQSRKLVWGPPGGKIELGETPEQALVRELKEEASVIIDPRSITPLFYTESYVDEPAGEWKFIGLRLRYMCRILSKEVIVADPDNDIISQIYCSIDDLPKYAQLGESADRIIESLHQFVQA